MSLINDALKKAQKRHAPGPGAPLLPPTPGGTPAGPSGRGSPFSGQLLFLCALGAVVLVAL
ncbi:MAG TPA: hypothetical protein VFB27_13955, partial [Opitutaceae bacterium]|nr:hypothetical protein [Opitutaceae bacterium]